MKDDPIVAEVRKVREEHAARYNYDLPAIYAALKQQEKQNPSPKASFSPKRIPFPVEDYGSVRTLAHVLREDADVPYELSGDLGQDKLPGDD